MKTSHFRPFRCSLATCLCFVSFVGAAQVVLADDIHALMEQRRREFEQRRQEIQAKHAEMLKQMQQQRGNSFGAQSYTQSYGAGSINRPQLHTDTSKFGGSGRMKGTSFDPLPFDAKKAPSPDLCFLKFVETANNATTLDQVLPYLPYAQQRVIKEEQQRWSPQSAAETRAQHLKLNPSITADALEFFSEAPYVRELNSLKDISGKIMRVRSIKYTGPNTAVLDVATRNNCRMNGEDYPYSTADVELLGQGNFWMFDKYRDSSMHYKAPQ